MTEERPTLRPRRHGAHAGFRLASFRLAITVIVFVILVRREILTHSYENIALVVMVLGLCIFAFWAWWQAARRCMYMELSHAGWLRCHTPLGARDIDPGRLDWVEIHQDGLVIKDGERVYALKDVEEGLDAFVAELRRRHPDLDITDRRS